MGQVGWVGQVDPKDREPATPRGGSRQSRWCLPACPALETWLRTRPGRVRFFKFYRAGRVRGRFSQMVLDRRHTLHERVARWDSARSPPPARAQGRRPPPPAGGATARDVAERHHPARRVAQRIAPPGRNGHARVRSASGPRPLPFSPGGGGNESCREPDEDRAQQRLFSLGEQEMSAPRPRHARATPAPLSCSPWSASSAK
eukprot:gene18214-biopygen5397